MTEIIYKEKSNKKSTAQTKTTPPKNRKSPAKQRLQRFLSVRQKPLNTDLRNYLPPAKK